MLDKAVEAGASITISSFEALRALEKIRSKKPIKIHIKVDTGMGRQGFLMQDLLKVLQILDSRFMIHKSPSIIIEGLYTHFATAKNPSFPKYTFEQISLFKKWVEAFRQAGYKPITHAAASSGTLIFPESHFDMVRVGISFYGLWPSPEVEAFCKNKFQLKLILSWKTIIGEVKTLKKGSQIGYDLTETLSRETRVAICPIGYWHGFPRVLSSIGSVLVRGKRVRVLGRVSMDMISVDVTGIKGVRVGDEVVVLGKQGKEEISANDLAYLSGTTNYEVVTRINPLIKRIYK
jgi:alanine racemase